MVSPLRYGPFGWRSISNWTVVELFLGNFYSPRLLATMERNQSEWIWLFGASIRSERATYFNDPMPKAMIAQLRAIKQAEHKVGIWKRKRTPPPRLSAPWWRPPSR
jgi:hypothetical protein